MNGRATAQGRQLPAFSEKGLREAGGDCAQPGPSAPGGGTHLHLVHNLVNAGLPPNERGFPPSF